MAKIILTDPVVSIDGNDVSDHISQLTINYEAEAQDQTAFGDDTRINAGGLKNWSMEFTAFNDEAAGEINSVLFPLVGSQVTVFAKGDSATTSATNPEYNGTGLVQSFSPLGGSVGENSTGSVSVQSAGTLSRATA